MSEQDYLPEHHLARFVVEIVDQLDLSALVGAYAGPEMAAELRQALGEEVRYNAVTPEAYRGFGFPGAEDLGNMFQFKRDFEDYYCGVRDLEAARSLNPELQSFAGWLARNKDGIPLS